MPHFTKGTLHVKASANLARDEDKAETPPTEAPSILASTTAELKKQETKKKSEWEIRKSANRTLQRKLRLAPSSGAHDDSYIFRPGGAFRLRHSLVGRYS